MSHRTTNLLGIHYLILVLLVVLFGHSYLRAQELVTNGGFESFSQLPTNADQIDRLDDWQELTFTPDYLNTGYNGVVWGTQNQGAFQGTGFVGFFSLVNPRSSNRGWSEGVYQQLQNGPLQEGESYEVSVATMMALNYQEACGGIRLFGISYEPFIDGRGIADTLQDVFLLWESPPNDQTTWQEYSGTFTSPADLDYIIFAFGWEYDCTFYGFIDEVSIRPQQPSIQGLPNDIALCDSSSVLLSLDNPGAQYTWQDGSTDSTFLVTSSGSYSVTISLNGNILQDTINVDLQQRPVLELPADTVVCGKTELRVETTLLADIYQWSTGDSGQETIVRSDGEVSLVASVGACTVRDTFSVAFRQNPTPALGPDRSACEGDTISLDVNFPGASIQWSDGSFGESLSSSQTGTYAVTVIDSTCFGSDTIALTFNALPVVELGEDIRFCETETIQLQANTIEANTNYLWSTNQSTLSILEVEIPENTSEQALTTEVILTGERLGCSSSDTILLTALRSIPFTLGQDTSICEGDSLSLSVDISTQNPFTIQWNTGQSEEEIFARTNGSYSAEVTSIDGCTTTDELSLTVEELPVLALEASYGACEGDTILLGNDLAQLPGVTYEWNDGIQSPTRTILAGGAFTITASTANCTTSATTEVLFDTRPVVDLGVDTTLCPGEQLVLFTPLDADGVRWQDGSDATEYVISGAGTYEVEVRSGNCTVKEAVRVSQPELPKEGELLEDVQSICRGEVVVLDATWPNVDFLWSTGESSSRILVDTPGRYSVTLTAEGCEVTEISEVLAPAAGECATCTTFLPTAFSPNGDAVNDELNIFFEERCALQSYRMQVYDRWGNQLFTSTDQNTPWDGTARGQELGNDVYTVIVELQFEGEPSSRILRGDVTLLR